MATETIRKLTDALGALIAGEMNQLKASMANPNRHPPRLSEIANALKILHEIERQERQFDLFSYPDIQVEYVRPESGKTETETA